MNRPTWSSDTVKEYATYMSMFVSLYMFMNLNLKGAKSFAPFIN
jgi:hypothetical protein